MMENFFDTVIKDVDEESSFTITDYTIETDAGCLEYDMEEGYICVNSINVYQKRRGIGTKIVQRLEEFAKENKISVIEVPVSPTYEAVSFWYAMDYKPSTREDKYWFNKLVRSDCERVETPQGVIVFDKNLKKHRLTNISQNSNHKREHHVRNTESSDC
jgi:hypothetical protein